jgi:hypothetical protein
VNVGAESDVVRQIPAVVIRIFVDYDVVAGPVPVVAKSEVKRGNAEIKATEPETAGTASGKVPDVSTAKAAGESAVFPGMVEMEAGIVTSSVMTDPGAVVMNVRSFGVTRVVVERRRRVRGSCVSGGRTMLGDESAADSVSASAVAAMLCPEGNAKYEAESENLWD